ncbi:MAG: hypothetical protein A3A10_01595 [Candidatus Tagabacteria bacterium RIFCSPLOWO2_01_FULL_42_9]|uniref:Glycosyl transferase family 1 domain-containing protein n=1 Tax=Candidatus Tagabacteria bacterium RIFCSPLOWO2_01_FULL_42_9 TaxID=1802296 RepID=A0A1G2LYU8_9BACT|nr:MAG: hypothetical protein A3A10_01595 [Candidatus Tagabacteria bacterium RIFCSPLOWO2_01_FULL_42_9]
MKLLIITQKIDQNDDILGFFHRWVEEFAKNCEQVVVIAQFVGAYDLPRNIEVFSLGKERGHSKARQLINFYKLLFKNLSRVDAVFVHMIPLWAVLGALFFKIYRKKVYLWYVHKSANWTLKLAEKLVENIFTASPESCRLKSDKIIITGHGIDINEFSAKGGSASGGKSRIPNPKSNGKFKIVSAGRIAPAKNLDILVEVAEILKKRDFSAKGGPALGWEIKIAGKPILEADKIYFEELKKLIKEKVLEDKIIFAGAIPNKDIADFYKSGDLFVNFSDTGSLDKAVLEAMAAGLLVLTSNEAFGNILSSEYFTSKNPKEIAEKIIMLSKSEPDPGLRDFVVKNHNLKGLIAKIIGVIKI